VSNKDVVQTGTGELLSVLGTQALTLLLGIGSSILLARTLGPTERGNLALYILIPGLISSLGSQGIHEATIYFLGKEKYKYSQVFPSNLLVAFTLGAIYIAGAIYISRTRFWPWPSAQGPLLWLAVCAIPFNLTQLYMRDILRVANKFIHFNTISLFASQLKIVPYLMLLFIVGSSVEAGVWANVVASFATAILSIVLILRTIGPIWGNVSWSYLKDGFLYGIRGHLGYSARKLGFRVDQLILGAVIGETALGYYVIAVNTAELLLYLSRSIALVLFPKIAARGRTYAREMTSTIFRLSILVSILSGTILALLGRSIITLLYGSDYLPGLTALYLLIPGTFFISLSAILNRFMFGIGKPEFNTYADVAGFATGVAAYAVLIPKYGFRGAAIGSSISYGVLLAVEVYFYLRETGCGLRSLIIVRRSDIFDFLKPKVDLFWNQMIAHVKSC
jgi:O-antigen/teichoic acid export membrane protein